MQEQVGKFIIEVDERITKTEVFHIGDAVKVFEKSYGDKYNVYPGIIVGFVKNDDMAAIEVLYITDEYSTPKMKRGIISDTNKDLSLASTETGEFGKQVVDTLTMLDSAIVKARFELNAAITVHALFRKNFGAAYKLDKEN
jgi:hypothetical protein